MDGWTFACTAGPLNDPPEFVRGHLAAMEQRRESSTIVAECQVAGSPTPTSTWAVLVSERVPDLHSGPQMLAVSGFFFDTFRTRPDVESGRLLLVTRGTKDGSRAVPEAATGLLASLALFNRAGAAGLGGTGSGFVLIEATRAGQPL